MGQPQYVLNPVFNGLYEPITPNINPGGKGVTFLSNGGSIEIEFNPLITPIVEYVSIANKTITNVNQLSVIIIALNGSVISTLDSPVGVTVITGFPIIPLPAGSTLYFTFQTSNQMPPQNVTLSIIACFHPELTTTGVSTTLSYSTATSPIPTISSKIRSFFYKKISRQRLSNIKVAQVTHQHFQDPQLHLLPQLVPVHLLKVCNLHSFSKYLDIEQIF